MEKTIRFTTFIFLVLCEISLLKTEHQEQCKDTDENCAKWADNGDCETAPDDVLTHCPVSCNASCICPDKKFGENDADKDCNCIDDAQKGYCETSKHTKERCPSTCAIREEFKCGKAPDIDNTVSTYANISKWLTRVTYKCAPYATTTLSPRKHNGERTCTQTHGWKLSQDKLDPVCIAKNCSGVDLNVANAVWTAKPVSSSHDTFPYDTTISYTCKPGFSKVSGDTARKCDLVEHDVTLTKWKPIVCKKKVTETPSPSPGTDKPSGNSDHWLYVYIGIAVAVIVLIVIAVTAYCCCKRKATYENIE